MFNSAERETEVEVEVEIVENTHVRFYRSIGNWAEFGLFFSGGLLVALLSRLIPGMLIAYGLMLLAIIFGAWSMAVGSGARPAEQIVIGVALLLSCVGGFWDAAWLFLMALKVAVEANPFWLIGLGGLGLLVVVLFVWKR